ncbi:EamA family transporter [Microbulbifer rhizosphaerae]|uniref:Inner membrane transporter RhtA n=1 Tax=Microbulbifer rhizosphaerae TaxID=1562603 RepID=A0A7W4WC85_9GAMM|nr:EamA family transporter [Microbulbifer rhizosphaerae]MBB3061577.1 inner membrane transporter RhtA [Microbulbifer rhizosphaerae]
MPHCRSVFTRAAEAVPPPAWFGVSAVFHYLGPSFAVLLFPAVGVLGVAWFRIATAALIFAAITRPWVTIRKADTKTRLRLLGMGSCLAVMNTSFYLALDRLPMSLVAAMEFVGTIAVALYGLRTNRNALALALAVFGVFLLIDVKWATDPVGLMWSALNAALFIGYILLGHKAAQGGASRGIEQLGAAMAIAFAILMPIGLAQAIKAFGAIELVLAGIGIGICSSVIPYVCDQLAMSRLPRASFALLLSLLPATATVIAGIVLAQIPTYRDIAGIALVMVAVAIHRQSPMGEERKAEKRGTATGGKSPAPEEYPS